MQGKNFEAYLHLAYSSLYSNNEVQTKENRGRAENYAATPAQRTALEKFDAVYEERKEFW
jgi:hypothetical protein